jgi:hypothetical protein
MRRVALSDFAALLCPCHTWLKPLFPRQNQVYPIRERKRFPNHRIPSWILTLIQGFALPPSSYFSGRSRMERSSTTLKQPNQSSREAKMRVKTDPARAIIPIPPKLSDFIAKTPRSNRRSQSFLNHLLRDLLGSSRLRVKNLNSSAIWYYVLVVSAVHRFTNPEHIVTATAKPKTNSTARRVSATTGLPYHFEAMCCSGFQNRSG